MSELWSEQYRLAAKDWVDKDAAARMFEETRSAFLSKLMLEHGDMPVSRAEMLVKASEEWIEFNRKMVNARTRANKAHVQREYLRMKFQEWNSHEATARVERRVA